MIIQKRRIRKIEKYDSHHVNNNNDNTYEGVKINVDVEFLAGEFTHIDAEEMLYIIFLCGTDTK